MKRFPIVLAALVLLLVPFAADAASPDIVISQVYGGGGNAGATWKNDFVELFNRGTTAIDVSTWSVQYAATGGTSWQRTNLSGLIAPGHYYLVQEVAGAGGTVNLPTPDAVGTIAMAAGAGKVALVNVSTALSGSCPVGATIVDFVGYGTTTNCFEGSGPTAPLTNTTAALRANSGCTDTDNNSSDFATGAPNPRNTASPTFACAGISLSINDVTVTEGNSGTTTATFTVSLSAPAPTGGVSFSIATQDNTATVADGDYVGKALVGQSISAGFQTYLFDVTVNGDLKVEPNETFFVNVSNVVGTGVTVADGQGVGTITNDDVILTPIHDIQGSGTTSPFAGSVLSTSGIVTGVKSNGFFIQARDSDVDADPNTSEGVFVFTSSAPPVTAAVGNEVIVTGQIQEFIPSADLNSPPATEIASPSVIPLTTGNPLPAPVTLTAADTNPAGSIEQLERFEGMRVHVDSLTVVAPTQGTVNEANATSTSSGVFYGVITGVARPFREPGVEVPNPLPAGAPCCVPRFDGNPERLRVDSDGLIGATRLEVTTGAVVTNLTGPLDYSFRTYTILPDPGSSPSVTGNISAIPVPVPASSEFTVASFNTERFFDTVNDPAVDDVALTAAAFANRLNKASLAIRNVMRTPDILGVEEMENLTTLQALAAKVNGDAVLAGDPNPNYQAYLVEGNDIGGIDVGFLVKGSPRVNVLDVTQYNKDETYIDPNTGDPALLNDRPSLILRAEVQPLVGPLFPITVIVNHLRSLSGVDDPVDGNRVRTKRRAQAESLANLIQARQTANPNERIVLVGDFNAYQFSDGYVDVIGTVKGTPAPADEVVLASSDLVNPDLTNLVDTLPPDQRYSYSFDGDGQVLDHVLVTSDLLELVRTFAFARNDADFPESYRGVATRPERVSDHDMPVATFRFPSADLSVTVSASSSSVTTGSSVTYTLTVSNAGPTSASGVTVTDDLPAALTFVSCASTGTGTCGSSGNHVTVTFPSLASGASQTITLVATLGCALANGAAVSNAATVSSATADPNGSNDTATASLTASNPPPAISCPAPVVLGNDPGRCSAAVDPGAATAVDNCPGAAVVGVRGDGRPLTDPYPVGTTTITWTATDSGGAAASCTQTVTVSDTQPPAIGAALPSPSSLWPPNHKMVAVTVSYTASDNCTAAPGCTLAVTSNEPLAVGDVVIVDAHHVQLRAERLGSGSGRNYTIVVTCTDAKGNASSRTATVTVPHDQGN